MSAVRQPSIFRIVFNMTAIRRIRRYSPKEVMLQIKRPRSSQFRQKTLNRKASVRESLKIIRFLPAFRLAGAVQLKIVHA